jgi:hypothetical protein
MSGAERSIEYQAGCRDAKSKSMEEKIDELYGAFFIGRDCFTIRVTSLELWMKIFSGVFTMIVAPVIVILVAKVFFGL